MKADKLPSGNYRLRKRVNGETITIMFDHAPSQNEMIRAVSDYVKTPLTSASLTFYAAALQYINVKKNVLSPRTVKEYKGSVERLSPDFTALKIVSIRQTDIQLEINRLAETLSPKSVKNYHAFIKSVIQMFRPDMVIKTTLPKPVTNEPYIPNDDEVRAFFEYIRAERPKYYVLIVLATYGMRRSEILAITGDDVTGNTLHITKALVQNEDNEWVIKQPKTPKSKREITIPQEIADMIKEKNCAFEGYPSDINKVISTACRKLGINHFTLHKLRHYFASKLLSENVDIVTVMALGGWSSPATLQKHYAHAMDEKKEKAMEHITNIVSNL